MTGDTDLLAELRRQWAVSGRRDSFDFDFAEAASAIWIFVHLLNIEFRRLPSAREWLTFNDAMILRALRRTPDKPVRPTDLSKRLLATSGAMTKRIQRLESLGLIKRIFHAEQKRGWLVSLTDKGRNLVDSELMNHETSHPITLNAFNSLSKRDRQELIRIHRSLIENVRKQTGLTFGIV